MMAAEEDADAFAAATSSSSGSSYRLLRAGPSKSAEALYENNQRVRAGRAAVAAAVAR